MVEKTSVYSIFTQVPDQDLNPRTWRIYKAGQFTTQSPRQTKVSPGNKPDDQHSWNLNILSTSYYDKKHI